MSKCYRLGAGAVVAVMLGASLCGAISARAQEITEFRDGYITFTNENPTLYYRVEFKPNLTDPADWDGAFRDLRNLHSSEAEVTVPVGVFYRVVGRETPWVAGTALASDLLSGKTAYVDDEEITGTMANVGQQNVAPGTTAQAITQGYHDGTGSVAGDAALVAENIKKDVTIFGVTGTYVQAAVPRTGQTATVPNNPAPAGSDGDLQRGVAWPAPRFTDNDDGTVTDNLTGLVWLKNADAFGTRTWANALADCAALQDGDHGLTDGSTAGDWRLPNVRELQSLIDYGRSFPALPSGHPFTGVWSAGYWSSSADAVSTSAAWNVNLVNGHVNGDHMTSPYRVWPVRCSEDGVSQTQIFAEDFNAVDLGEAPAGWHVDATVPEFTWAAVESYGADSSSLDGTPFLFVDSDAAGMGYNLYETITTPSVDATGHDGVFLAFEQYYRQFGSQVGTVQVYDGSEWQTVAQYNETHGSWTDPDEAVIDIADYANDAMQVRFAYEGSNDFYWAIDNVRIYGEPAAD